MSLGYDRELKVFNLGDTAELEAALLNNFNEPFEADELISVKFTIQAPDGTRTEKTGEINDDGLGILYYNGTDQLGHYSVVATFRTENGLKSCRADFETIDPFNEKEPSPSWVIANDAWEKFEDCFDGEEEGPWLRDMTLNVFNKRKMENFIDDALMDINLQHPPTSLQLNTFVGTEPSVHLLEGAPLLTQSLVVQLIKHLMRSYVEQPNPTSSMISWHDRRDYLQRWKLVLEQEEKQYERMRALWKRQFLGLGSVATLVSSKAGRLLPAPMRTRNVGRGYW